MIATFLKVVCLSVAIYAVTILTARIAYNNFIEANLKKAGYATNPLERSLQAQSSALPLARHSGSGPACLRHRS